MSKQDHLTLSNGEKVFYNEKNINQYLGKITILYGATMTGKTTLMFDILQLLKEKIAIPIVFCPTADSDNNSTYKNSFPSSLIYREVNIDQIKQIYNTQKNRANKYKAANNLNLLRSLFNKIASEHDRSISNRILSTYKKATDRLERKNHDIGTKKALKRLLDDKKDKNLKAQWRNLISRNRDKLSKMDLSEMEKIVLKYLDINPHLLLIFDDCAAQARDWAKSPIMKELFFCGRHNYITQIYTMQNDKCIPPHLRQNAHNSAFTDECSANAFFGAKSNGISKPKQKLVEKISDNIFTIKNGLDTYTKLIYSNNWHQPITVTIADIHEDTKMGSQSVWEFDKSLPRKNQKMFDMDNDKSYMESFY